MPELPEVETIRRQLEEKIVGKTIESVEIFAPKMFIGDPKDIIGAKIVRVGRRAKVLRIHFENKNAFLAHFKLNGQFFYRDAGDNSPARFTCVVFHFTDGSRLLFNDSRKFGWIKVMENFSEESAAAIEPFCPDFTLKNFSAVLAKSRRPVKPVLMDQEKIGGIGNIYANEALFAARISPFRPANSLNIDEAEKLRGAIVKILQKAIDCRGSSGKDEWYRQLDGSPGGYQNHFLVYQKNGQKCPRCGGVIMRQNQAGRGTFYCSACQK
jgi:formamidopyrimidine-DNA glycosylase